MVGWRFAFSVTIVVVGAVEDRLRRRRTTQAPDDTLMTVGHSSPWLDQSSWCSRQVWLAHHAWCSTAEWLGFDVTHVQPKGRHSHVGVRARLGTLCVSMCSRYALRMVNSWPHAPQMSPAQLLLSYTSMKSNSGPDSSP